MAEMKTKKTAASVAAFLGTIADPARRKDCESVAAMMRRATGAPPKMWGAGIVGFGSCRLKYPSGREIDWFPIGFSPRKQDLTLYGLLRDAESERLLARLGTHARGKGCLYIRRLDDVDRDVLQALIERGAKS